MNKSILPVLAFILLFQCSFSQGLEDVILETYYISDANDATDSDGGLLPAGTTTYRIFLDMAPGYKLETVYGSPMHELRIETTTLFFNNEDRGEVSGNLIGDNRLDDNTVALDSWITIGAASEAHFGVLKTDDTDGSIVGGENNDGGSAGIPGGLLTNEDPEAGIPLTEADGLIDGAVSDVTLIADDPSIFDVFDNVNDGPVFSTNNGAWAILGGLEGQTAENRILVAQITTNGDLSFSLNVRLSPVDGSSDPIDYVSGTPSGDEIFFPQLNFPFVEVEGCTSPTACNYNPQATTDDGSCLEPEENCTECNGEELVIIDDDGDGICNAEEIAGCQNPTACNFDPQATDDDGSCLIPEPECTECDGQQLVLLDDDGDGICNAEEVEGCTDPIACNFDPAATDDDGSCLVPEENCTECDGAELLLIDDDGDGVCNANEVLGCTDPDAINFNPDATEDDGSCEYEGVGGCTSPTACNFDPEATADDGSCLEPEENCTECDGEALVLIDDDGDGICNADEIDGCTDPTACNFDPEATDDDGSCLIPEENCTECQGDTLILIDDDGDGICNADEVDGCTDPMACNFNPEATDEDGSCLIPEENCTECDGEELVLIDDDGDGICNEEEIPGCTDPDALNYDPEATDDDGSCMYLSTVDLNQTNGIISIYPNPVKTKFMVEQVSQNLDLTQARYSIYDVVGNRVSSGMLNLMGEGDVVQKEFPDIASGLYMFEILSADERFVIRLIKKD